MKKYYSLFILFLISIVSFGNNKISLFFAGDTYFGWGAEYMYLNRISKNDSLNLYELPWLNINNCIKADKIIVNFEGTILSKGNKIDKEFNLKMQPDFTKMLQTGNIDIVNLANNHTMDFGSEGLDSTIYYLNKHKIKFFGAGENIESALKPVITNVKNTTICLTGLSIIGPETVFAGKNSAGSAGSYDLEKIIHYAEKTYLLYKDSCDIMIIYMHWGKEKKQKLSYAQKYLSHKLIDMGYDAIIGSHPHIVQGIECYKGKYIFYSLGNFIFGGNDFDPEWTIGVNLFIENKKIIDYKVIPLYTLPQKTLHSPYPANDSLQLLINDYLKNFNLH